MTAVKLTSLSHGAGCACKVPAALLAPLVGALPQSSDPNLLVGTSTSDDAGVYRVRDDLALVQTVDFFTAIVDDPYDFGRIAATNALSDVYAMGGRPVSALNLVAWSIDELGSEMLGDVLRGGHDVATAAGVAIVGGHTIDDREPKYGMAVTGVVDPREVITNAGGRAGDVLVLTKPVGAGAVTTALKKGSDRRVRPRRRGRGHDRAERGRIGGGAGGRRPRDDRRDRVRTARPSARAGACEWRVRGGGSSGGAGDPGRARAARGRSRGRRRESQQPPVRRGVRVVRRRRRRGAPAARDRRDDLGRAARRDRPGAGGGRPGVGDRPARRRGRRRRSSSPELYDACSRSSRDATPIS